MAPYDGPPDAFVPPGAMDTALAFVSCVLLLGVGVTIVIALAWLRARALRATQERQQALLRQGAEKPLSEGTGRVVRGRVELESGEDAAIEIDIAQSVQNRSSRSARWHTWTEVSRRVRTVRPFYLVTDDGQVVYVEPDEDAQIIDSLATTYPIDQPGLRIRTADVRRGEVFHAYGDLYVGHHPRAAEGYRDGAGWILRRPRSGRLLLATNSVENRYDARINFLRRWAGVMAFTWCIFHGWCTAPFVAAVVFGRRTTAEIVRANRNAIHNSRGGSHWVYALTATAPDGFSLDQTVTADAYAHIARLQLKGETVTVPMIRTGNWKDASYLGTEPYAYIFPVALALIWSLSALLGLWRGYESTSAWYESTKFVERGDGVWEETRPDVPIAPGTN